MYEPATIPTEQLLDDLSLLCTHPSSTGQLDELLATARVVADLLRRAGLHVKAVRTPGAPVILGWRDGQSASRLLLYHHYDVAPAGPWRDWFHDPFQLGEREGMLYGRGVAHGKGPLAATIQTLRALLRVEDSLPCGLAVVVEGEGLTGSPHLASVVAQHADELQATACLSTAGERDMDGRPFCYSGSKGLLRVNLRSNGSAHPLPSGLAASVPNPVWRLAWALNHIKGDDEDIRINGFYDQIAGPERGEREMLRKVKLDEAGRLASWNIPSFLFEMAGTSLTRSEVTLPTCNVSSFLVEPPGNVPCIPVAASAQVDFQLVPDQDPGAIMSMLRKHLSERGFDDIDIKELPGSYPPIRTSADQPLMQRLIAAGERVHGEPLVMLPLGPFAQPLHTLAHYLDIPVAVVALARHSSAFQGPNERLPLEDFIHHSQLLAELMLAYSDPLDAVEVNC